MENNQTKVCSKCKIEQELSCFSKNKSGKDGLQCHCKLCVKQFGINNREKRKSYLKQYYEKNFDKLNSYRKQYIQENSKRISEYKKDYNILHKEKIAIKRREYKQKNKETLSLKKKEYCESNKKIIAIKNKAYYETNKEIIALKQKIYSQTPKAKAVEKNAKFKRRTIKKQGDVTTQQLLELEQNAKVCYWCGVSLKKVKVHIDHYIPLAKGGQHTLSNLVVSCHKCNCSKQAKDPLEFANTIGKLL